PSVSSSSTALRARPATGASSVASASARSAGPTANGWARGARDGRPPRAGARAGSDESSAHSCTAPYAQSPCTTSMLPPRRLAALSPLSLRVRSAGLRLLRLLGLLRFLRRRAELAELLVHGAQQEDQRDSDPGHDEEAEQPRLHVVHRGVAGTAA